MSRVVQELDTHSYDKAIADLDLWTERYHETEYADERVYYYMLAYNGLNQPAKVVDSGAPLLLRPVSDTFEDPMQALSVLYVTVTNFQKLSRPMRDQSQPHDRRQRNCSRFYQRVSRRSIGRQ